MIVGSVLDIVSLDHCYSKPWSAHPDASNARPMRTLFMEKFPRNRTLEQSMPEPDLPVDVISYHPHIPTTYDVNKAKTVMKETEKQLFSLKDDKRDDWEDKLNRSGWNPQQNRLFTKISRILNSDRLSKLAIESNMNEATLRRNQVDKTAKRVRQTLASVRWDVRLTQWLHGVVLDNLSTSMLATYIEVLQTLRTKVPNLVDRMTAGTGYHNYPHGFTGEVMSSMLKKSWDPVASAYSQNKLQKLPCSPLILVAPSGPTNANTLQSKRMRYWTNQLASLGKVIPVTMHTVNNGSGVSIAQCLEHMIMAVKTKVLELKNSYTNRPIILLGWNIGSLVACHVALQDAVSAVVCLGFPYTGVGGGRGDADDPLLDSRTPTLFVIGQNANTSSIDDIEDLREKIRADNSLLVVGGADDNLRMSRAKRKMECLTQVMVDKMILDEVAEFLGGILSQGPMLQESSVVVDLSDLDHRKQRKPQPDPMDVIDGNDFQVLSADSSRFNPQGRMTIAKALRARALSGSSTVESTQSYGTSTPSIAVPNKVKRKYTKRKNVNNKSPGSTPTPRKRFRSTPTPPVASPVTSIQSPLSAGLTPNITVSGVPELSGLLKAQQGTLPSYRIISDKGEPKGVIRSSPQISINPTSLSTGASSSGVQTPMVIGGVDEPLVAYKLEDYNRKFNPVQPEPEPPASKPITIEGLLRNQRLISTEATPNTSTPISSLLSLARHMPTANLSSASSVSNQIQQLLSCLAKSSNISPTTGSVPSPVLTPLKMPGGQSTMTDSFGLLHSSSSLSTPLPSASISQSGSPLQNSVPTLMSSLTKTTSLTGGNIIKITTSANTMHDELKPPAVQKLQFPESSLDTLSRLASITENSMASSTIQLLDNTPPTISSVMDSRLPIQIPVNRSNAYTTLSSSSLVTSGLHQISSLGKPILIPDDSPTIIPTQKNESPTGFSDSPIIIPDSGSTAAQGGHSYTHSYTATPVETLGKVSSMLESSPITEYASYTSGRATSTLGPSTISTATLTHQRLMNLPHVAGLNVGTPVTSHRPTSTRASPNVTVSYTATPKQTLSTSSTRTRRIKTPKQFDL